MKKREFIEQYVCTFLASYMAGRYDDDCQNGHPNEPYDHQPIEDARFCADRAWKQYYNPYEIGRRLFEDGYGISFIAGAVECDEDIEEAERGYNNAAGWKSHYDYR